MEIKILGSVELWAHGEQIPLPSTKLRQLLVALLWDGGRPIATRTLIQRVWGDDAPPRELTSLQVNATKLRKCLDQCGDPTITLTNVPAGYRLSVPADCVDRVQFEQAQTLAEGAAKRGNLAEAIRLLRSAEALVRGEEPLAGLVSPWIAEKRAELEERIREVAVRRLTLQATMGDTSSVLPELRRLATKHQFDESILALFMRTLRAVGRITDALDAYTLFRTKLHREKGLDPSAHLKKLHQEILRDDPAPTGLPVSPAAPRAPVPNTLDRNPTTFVGRRDAVEAITAEIDSQLAAGTSVVFAVDGMPGVGKTTLALHLAHRLLSRCPDGAMQLNLRGHDEQQKPTDPESALGILLGMLGAQPLQVQRAGNLDLAISLWRKMTSGKRLLLLLDDAAGAEQITPLLPSGTSHIVLITARNRLTGLPEAMRHPLEAMTEAEGGELFIQSARISPTTDPALPAVVTACGGFPLALAIAGKAFRTRQAWSIADLVEHMANTRNAHMRRPDAIISPLFRAFSTSYRDLPDLERMLLRRLSLNPGLRTHLRAAAALVDAEPSETDAALFNLVEQNLLMEPERRYYQLHDMMRIFAAHACEIEETPEDREAAADRLMYFTVGAVDAATRLFYPYRHVLLTSPAKGHGISDGFGFSDFRQATKWLESEQQWLRTAIEHWFANGHPQEAATVVHLLSKFLDRKNLWKESRPLHERSLEAWRESGNLVGEAHTLVSLAAAHWRLGTYAEALDYATRAMDRWTALGDIDGCTDALLQLGRIHYAQHRNAEAIDCFGRCARHWQDSGDRQAAAEALQHLSAAQFDFGRHKQGIATVEEALELSEGSDDLVTRCNCHNNLGAFLVRLGDHARAEIHYQQAVVLAEEIGEINRIAAFALNLAVCQIRLNRPESALPLLDRAFETFSRFDDRYYVTSTMIAQAEAHLGLGRTRDAQALIDAAALPAEQFGDSIQLARVHVAYGQIYSACDNLAAALRAYRLALGFASEAGVPYMQGIACRHLGDLYELMDRPEAARRCWRRALDAYGDVRSPETEALTRKLARDEM